MKLELQSVSKKYNHQLALDDFSFSFSPGVYGLLGSNGAGKSTLMNLLTDNIERTSGKILWNGEEIVKLGAAYRACFGYMPQQSDSLSKLTVAGFLEYIGYLKGLKKEQLKKERDDLVQRLNLNTFLNKRICDLSGGMRQRVMLAQALLSNPQILFLDEPTAGLDPQERIRIRNLLMSLSQDRIILLATHIVSDIECIADYVLLLKNGKLVQHGTPVELINHIAPHVHEIGCKREELELLQVKYPTGRVIQKPDGLYFRWVDNQIHDGKKADIGLEEVFIGVNSMK
ncbi:MAG: ATP-binding cassette domain-containing protein [Agathobacter sp.]